MPIPAETAPQKPPRRRETALEALKVHGRGNTPLLLFAAVTVISTLVWVAMLGWQSVPLTLAFLSGGFFAYLCFNFKAR